MGCNHVTGTPFTDGRPEIVDGSPQTAYLSVVRYSPDPDEIDPVLVKPTTLVQKRTCPTGGYQCLVNAQSLAHGQDVLFWDMTSTGTKTPGAIVINGTTMATGDAAWPQLTNFKHGGNGSMFFAPARILTRAASRVSIVPAAPASAIHYPRYSPLGPQERWVLPVRITYACMDEATTQGPFWLALNIDRSGILNADPAAGAEPGNPAYVTVRAGITPATGPVVLGDRVTAMRCASSRLPLTLTTYIEFAHPPTTADLDSLTLLGTPDGTADFEAWVPPSAPAAPQTSPSPTVPAQDAPDTDYQLAIKAGWQYNAFEPEEMGITLASTGDGLADELGIDNESGAQPGLSVSGPGYVLPGSTAGSKSECFSRLVNNDEYGVGLWYPGGVDPLPWDRLGQGVQACINSGGNIISLLTVLAPWDGNQIVVDAKSWKCTPPAGESVC
jgi:hypothetical protein